MNTAPVDLAMHTRQIALHAYRLTARLSHCVSLEDLMQVGWEALLCCQARYHASPATLQTYADRRIAGAMLDELSAMGQRPRHAQRQGVPPYNFVPLQDSLLPATPATEPEPFLAALVARLPQRLQLVLRLSYVEGWQLREISAELGCTEGRVSQIRTQALTRLRKMLGLLTKEAPLPVPGD